MKIVTLKRDNFTVVEWENIIYSLGVQVQYKDEDGLDILPDEIMQVELQIRGVVMGS